MLDKEELRRSFSKEHKKYYQTKILSDEGFERRECKACGKGFWTAEPSRELCGDAEHEGYSFIKESPTEQGYADFWKMFAKFFSDNGHSEIPTYPVVSRWRQDLYFTIASIQDFQRIESGKMSFEYQKNPLVVPQICLRFNDIPNVGVTGRHFTSFMMAGQHSFNYPKEGYWREETMKLDYGFLTKHIGVKRNDLSYVEDVWAMGDFSEFGPCIEGFAGGLELVNNVFTEFEYLDGTVSELNGKVVDVGWGFERLLWYKTGAQTIYDAVFPGVISKIYKSSGIRPDHKMYARIASLSGKIDISERSGHKAEDGLIKAAGIDKNVYESVIKPQQAVYAIADHTRTLLFAINDGALPSNVGGGYNLRVIFRRMLDFAERYGIDIDLVKLVEMHANELKPLYPGIEENIETIKDVFDIEKRRYAEMKANAGKVVGQLLERKEKISMDKFRTLYQSNGITPDFIRNVAAGKGLNIEIDEKAYSDIIKGDFSEKRKEVSAQYNVEGLEKTKRLYYDFAERANARVIKVFDNAVVLDQTPFYPEGGGQEADHGSISGENVVGANAINGVVVHILQKKPPFKAGDRVECAIDHERRTRLMAHHTATHLISAAARSVLGKHAWQEGAAKGAGKAHIDIAHFDALSAKQVSEMERQANLWILNGIKVDVNEVERAAAESEYGFSIYQGHGVPAAKLRIVTITDIDGNLIDAEACGGLHVKNREYMLGIIRIINYSKIHDGVNRIEYVAGKACSDYIDALEKKINSVAEAAGIDKDKIEGRMPQLVRELDVYRKRYNEALQHLSAIEADAIIGRHRSERIIEKAGYNRLMLREIATRIAAKDEKAVALLYNDQNEIVCVSGIKSGISADAFLRENLGKISKGEFRGGGTGRISEGVIQTGKNK